MGREPTVENYFGRVTKSRILEAIRESRGETAARLMEHLKKADMAVRAQELLCGAGWLPAPLRTLGQTVAAQSATPDLDPVVLTETAEHAGRSVAMVDFGAIVPDTTAVGDPAPIAAE